MYEFRLRSLLWGSGDIVDVALSCGAARRIFVDAVALFEHGEYVGVGEAGGGEC